MNKLEKLASILKRLNKGEDPKKMKAEAKAFLSSVDASELTMAEQQLIESGTPPEELRHLCVAHMELLGNEVEKMKAKLPKGHVIRTLVSEHEKILWFLDKLEENNQLIQKLDYFDKKNEAFDEIRHIAEHLVEAEPHHKREEDVLFPELEKRSVFGPPQIMRLEHVELRKMKKDLLEIAKSFEKSDFNGLKGTLDSVSKNIGLMLRDHIFKENNILYPTALQVIQEESAWIELKKECDKIGYCCFTPEE